VDVQEYVAVAERISSFVREPGTEPVPACPGWTVRDVVAHLAGLCDDWVEHRLDGYATEEWTARQIARFEGHSLGEILDEWSQTRLTFVQLDADPVMGPPARWAFGDGVTHEADLRGALSAGQVPCAVVEVALKGAVSRWRQVLRDAAAPTLLIQVVDGRDWWLGTPEDPDAIVVQTSAYEVFRSLAGRRSVDQIRSWNWSRDPAAYLTAGPPYPFSWAAQPLND
jgi:uncharacterized protein (TIGR03083 family)